MEPTFGRRPIDRTFRPEEVFALQDQLVPRIVSTVADQHGILPRSISAAIRKKGDAQLSPYEAVFRVFGLHERMTQKEHATVRDLLERAVQNAPDHGDCWAMLATLDSDEYWFGFNVRPDPLGRALAAAQRAVEVAPASALASQALAQILFLRRERQAFGAVAERTIALNPMDGATTALMGILLACAGDWEHGCAVADSAMRLNPNFPGWYWLGGLQRLPDARLPRRQLTPPSASRCPAIFGFLPHARQHSVNWESVRRRRTRSKNCSPSVPISSGRRGRSSGSGLSRNSSNTLSTASARRDWRLPTSIIGARQVRSH